jgi:hypothetical protein
MNRFNWIVRGQDEHTGAARREVVRASNRSAARRKSLQDGILIESIGIVADPKSPDPLSEATLNMVPVCVSLAWFARAFQIIAAIAIVFGALGAIVGAIKPTVTGSEDVLTRSIGGIIGGLMIFLAGRITEWLSVGGFLLIDIASSLKTIASKASKP